MDIWYAIFLFISAVICSTSPAPRKSVHLDIPLTSDFPLSSPSSVLCGTNSVSDDQPLLQFRISNDATQYYHSSTENFYQMISERHALYALLFKIAERIESFDLKGFERVLRKNEEMITFCMRFHLIFVIFNCRDRRQFDAPIMTEMIEILTSVRNAEIPTALVMEQFKSFQNTVNGIIRSIPQAEIVESINNYLSREYEKIRCYHEFVMEDI